jgi:methionyl-tRNA formyltransferase
MNKGKIKVIFFGNNILILDCLIKNSNLQSVFCQPLEKNNASLVEVEKITGNTSIPFHQPDKKMLYNYIDYIRNLDPDLIVVCGYKYILPGEIFNIPKFRTINIHPSYLPNYRGQHVINWAIVNGESETGVTIHYIDKGIDTGDIIVQRKVPILFEDTASTLSDKIYLEASELLRYILNNISSEKALKAKKQNDSKASYFRPRTPQDGRIDWSRDGIDVYNLIRALVKPWPGAYTYMKNKKIIFWSARFEACSHDFSPGTIIDISDSNLIISVNNGKLSVNKYMSLDKNGNEINLRYKIGDKFEKESDEN